MSKNSPEQMLQSMIDNLPDKTGKPTKEWLNVEPQGAGRKRQTHSRWQLRIVHDRTVRAIHANALPQ